MAIVCPSCNKRDVFVDTCPRCNSDLSVLIKILGTAEYYFQSGLRFLSQGKWHKALRCSEMSWDLKNDVRTAELAFASSLLCKNDSRTAKWYRRVKKCDFGELIAKVTSLDRAK